MSGERAHRGIIWLSVHSSDQTSSNTCTPECFNTFQSISSGPYVSCLSSLNVRWGWVLNLYLLVSLGLFGNRVNLWAARGRRPNPIPDWFQAYYFQHPWPFPGLSFRLVPVSNCIETQILHNTGNGPDAFSVCSGAQQKKGDPHHPTWRLAQLDCSDRPSLPWGDFCAYFIPRISPPAKIAPFCYGTLCLLVS